MLRLILVTLVVLVIATAGLAAAGAAPVDYLTMLISLAALLVSLLAAFKEDLFPFRPAALLDEVTLAAPSPTDKTNPVVLLPLAFMNEGHGAGVIEGLTLKIYSPAATMIYTPVIEVDYPKFISGHRSLHAENILGAFNMFPLQARAAIRKSVGFAQEPNSERYPLAEWTPGEYTFCLYMKRSGVFEPILASKVKHTLSAALLASYRSGTSQSMSPSRELRV